MSRHWYERAFLGTLAHVPDELRARREDPQLFLEVLDHWHWLSECEGSDVELYEAAESYADTVLRFEPPEPELPVDPMDPDDLQLGP